MTHVLISLYLTTLYSLLSEYSVQPRPQHVLHLTQNQTIRPGLRLKVVLQIEVAKHSSEI